MYGCESWIIKKAEHQRIDAFELWCWRRLLRVPWTARRSNQSIVKEISPGCSLEGLMLKLKLQYFDHLMRRADSPWFWERLKAGREGDNRGWDSWMASLTRWTQFEQAPEVGDGQGSLACCSPWECSVGHDWATELHWASLDISQCSAQLCLTLCNPMDCSPPGSSVHEISQEEYWVVFHFLLQGILLTQEWNLHLLCLLHWQMGSLSFVSPGKPSSDIEEMQITSTCLAEWLKLVNNIKQRLMRLWGKGKSYGVSVNWHNHFGMISGSI